VIEAALKVPDGTDEVAAAQLVGWTRSVVEAVLKGTQDMPFATSFLAAQTIRLQPARSRKGPA
jgi:hypothetical protein